MKAVFKCQECSQTFSQNMEDWRWNGREHTPAGMLAASCPNCKSLYMDCQNIEECLAEAKRLDIARGYITE